MNKASIISIPSFVFRANRSSFVTTNVSPSISRVAEKVGICVRQLHRWRKQPEFKQAVIERALDNVKDEIADVFQANMKQAKRGNMKAVELIYKLLGLLVDKQEINAKVEDARDNESINKDIAELERLLEGID